MDPTRWERVEAICLAAGDHPAAERARYVREACGDDRELEREVASLLEAMDGPDGLLDRPMVRLAEVGEGEGDGPPDASRFVGPYRLIRPLGKGGMGEVYLAVRERDDFQQSVAVKVVRPGMNTGDFLRRFRLERRILASLRHAHIAQLLDGGAITTATDVYGLGVLLYELLSGAHPYGSHARSAVELEHLIREVDPAPPSVAVTGASADGGAGGHRRRLRRRLAGDLDNIVMKAIRKEPERRYTSAAALSDDIGRHLDGRPVRARPDSLAYRTRKFLQRNGWAVAAAAAVFLGLVSTSVVTAVQSRRVSRERDKALEVRSFLLETFGATGADRSTGDSVTARQLLDGQREAVAVMYADDPDLHAEMVAVLAEGYERLGLYSEALPLAEEALALRRELYGSQHADVGASLNLLGWLHHQLADPRAADSILREAVAVLRRSASDDAPRFTRALNDLGVVEEAAGNYDAARAFHREALERRTAALGTEHRSVGVSASNLSVVLFRQGQYADATAMAERALAALRASLGPDHQRSMIVQGNLAAFASTLGDFERAEAMLRDLVERQTRLQGERHPVTTRTITSLATVLNNQNKREEAEAWLLKAAEAEEATLGPRHPNYANTLSNLGVTVARAGDRARGLQYLERALDIHREALGSDHARVAETLGQLSLITGPRDPERWLRYARESVETYERALGPDHVRTADQRLRYADVLIRVGRPNDGLAQAMRAHRSVTEADPEPTRLVHLSRLRLTEASLALGDVVRADSLLAVSRVAAEAGELRASLRRRYDRLRRRVDSLLAR